MTLADSDHRLAQNYHRNIQKLGGFTLVEMSVVLVIIALLTGSILVLGNARIGQSRVDATKQRIAIVEKALIAFAETNRRLPCPAYPGLKYGDAFFGEEAGTLGSCNTNIPDTTWLTANTAIGSIPARSLGLPDELMYDSWGDRFTYVVNLAMTASSALEFNPQTSTCGKVTIQDQTGQTLLSNAIYVLISHGEDKHGAFNSQGTRVNANIINTGTLRNANTNTGFAVTTGETYNANIAYEDPTNNTNRFDDILVFRSRKDLGLSFDQKKKNFSTNNRPTPLGWVYVPPYTLPTGVKVPGFEMMKYEASNPDGDNIPKSIPEQTSWAATLVEARRACQRLDKNYTIANSTTNNSTGYGEIREYDIITESQWLSMANQMIGNSSNWISSCGETQLLTGHTDNAPAASLATSKNDSDGFYGTGQSLASPLAQQRQKRTLVLPNGQVVWDVVGNLNEWTYCDLTGLCKASGMTNLLTYTNGQKSSTGLTYNYNSSIVADGKTEIFMPPARFNNSPYKNEGTLSVESTSNNFMMRGGGWSNTTGSGLFSLILGSTSSQGFRCVHNLAPVKPPSPINFEGLDIWYDASDLDANGIEEELDNNSSTHETNLLIGAACSKAVAAEENDGCVAVWKNKARIHIDPANTWNYNARGRRMDLTSYGTDEAFPTLKLNALNGRPVVNFNSTSSNKQWLDTKHGISGSGDTGQGYNFDTLTQFTIFAVISGPKPGGLITANDDGNQAFGEGYIVFPYNTADDGNADENVFITSKKFAGNDLANVALNASCGDMLISGGGGCFDGAYYAGCAKMGGPATGTGLAIPGFHIITGVFNPGVDNGLAAYVDGGVVHSKDSAVHVEPGAVRPTPKDCSGNPVNVSLLLGVQRVFYWATYANANVAEILIYNRALMMRERQEIERYLGEKYKVSLQGR